MTDKEIDKSIRNEIKQDFKVRQEKHQQIEEMVQILEKTDEQLPFIYEKGYGFGLVPLGRFAEALYNAGYRKVGENDFILTNDNAEQLADLLVTSPQMVRAFKTLIEKWRKETAKEIYHDIVTDKTPEPIKKEWQKYFSKFGVEV